MRRQKVVRYRTFREWARAEHACEEGLSTLEWHQSPQDWWNGATNPGYMLWLARRLADRRLIPWRIINKIDAIVCGEVLSDVDKCDQIRSHLWRLPEFYHGDFITQSEVALLVRTLKEHRAERGH